MNSFPNDPKKMDGIFSIGQSAEDDANDADDMDEIDEIGEYVQTGRAMSEAQDEEKKNPYNNRKNHLITAAILLGMMLLLIFAGLMKQADEQRIAAQRGLIDLITFSDAGLLSDGGKIGYYTLANGRLYDAETFEPSDCERFVSRTLFRSGTQNLLTDRSIYPDADMDEYPDTDTPVSDPNFDHLISALKIAEPWDQDSHIRFFRTEGHYFACIDSSASLWTQYNLYYYSPEHRATLLLTTLSGQDIVSIRLSENFTEKADALFEAQGGNPPIQTYR